ncbi:hypothetical protein SAMN05216553_103124 [Lentzea fradiae]|uniref:Uncharacterized protein n=1 Tax=Lentzea fradiae TaxID=200378 RepID=A0A1G7NNX2_9PSEU|nr:hypothetical protein [Lentzea fradiae]SDF75682.1 hypothetical protein SAMN05216553_103124 [Lentzea fradiae]
MPITSDRPTSSTASTRRPLNPVLIGIALALLIAGVATPHALLVAAGLVLAGLIGLSRT